MAWGRDRATSTNTLTVSPRALTAPPGAYRLEAAVRKSPATATSTNLAVARPDQSMSVPPAIPHWPQGCAIILKYPQ